MDRGDPGREAGAIGSQLCLGQAHLEPDAGLEVADHVGLGQDLDGIRIGHAVVIAFVVAAADAVGDGADAGVVDVLLLNGAGDGHAVPLYEVKIVAPGGLPGERRLMTGGDGQVDGLALGVRDGQRGRRPLGPHAILVLHADADGVAAVGEVDRRVPCLLRSVDRSGGVAARERQLIGLLLRGLPGDARARAGGLDDDGRGRWGVDGDKLGLVAPRRGRAVGVVGAHAPVFRPARKGVRGHVVVLIFAGDGRERVPGRAVGGPLQVGLALRRAGGNDVLPREAVGDGRVDDDAGWGDRLAGWCDVRRCDFLPCRRCCRSAVRRHLYAPLDRPGRECICRDCAGGRRAGDADRF